MPRRSSLLLRLALLLFFTVAPAQRAVASDLRLTSQTLLRFFERDTATREDARVIPLYEYLRLDGTGLGLEGLSVHAYGWGRVDLADEDYFRDRSAGELLYAYLDYRPEASNLRLRAGRQYLFTGVINDSIDGLRLDAQASPWLNATLFGGQPVDLDSTAGRSGDRTWGGRLAGRYLLHELGISYQEVRNDSDRADERLGFDLTAALPGGVDVNGRSMRNLRTDSWAEHAYEARFTVGPLRLRPFLERFDYEDYFAAGARSPSTFLFIGATGDTLTSVGGEVLWLREGASELGARVRHLDYDRRGGSAQFYTVLANWRPATVANAGVELGRMEGRRADDDFWLLRTFTYWERLPANPVFSFVSGDVVYVRYDEELFGRDDSFFVSAGGGRRFLDEALEIRLSGDYSIDPYHDDDLRGLLTAIWSFDL